MVWVQYVCISNCTIVNAIALVGSVSHLCERLESGDFFVYIRGKGHRIGEQTIHRSHFPLLYVVAPHSSAKTPSPSRKQIANRSHGCEYPSVASACMMPSAVHERVNV